MAQNYYSLQEAATILAKAPEDLVQMVRKGELRGFTDAVATSSAPRTSMTSSKSTT